MSSPTVTTKMIRRVNDIGTVIQALFADLAAVIRNAESGLDLQILGALNAAVRVGSNTPVMVYNSDTATHYVVFGATEAVSAPSTPANGIPIKAGEKYVVNSGSNVWIISDSALVYGYAGDQG